MEGCVKRLKEKLADARDRLEELEQHLLDDRKHFTRCDYCERVKHSSRMFSCSVNGHYVCEDHNSIRIDCFDVCVICIEARNVKAKQAFVALSICLKRNDCHKDIYSNVFIPLMKQICEESWEKDEWDE